MASRSIVALVMGMALVGLVFSSPAAAQNRNSSEWSPAILADGQPDIQGMWSNLDALATPMELPDGMGRPDVDVQLHIAIQLDYFPWLSLDGHFVQGGLTNRRCQPCHVVHVGLDAECNWCAPSRGPRLHLELCGAGHCAAIQRHAACQRRVLVTRGAHAEHSLH